MKSVESLFVVEDRNVAELQTLLAKKTELNVPVPFNGNGNVPDGEFVRVPNIGRYAPAVAYRLANVEVPFRGTEDCALTRRPFRIPKPVTRFTTPEFQRAMNLIRDEATSTPTGRGFVLSADPEAWSIDKTGKVVHRDECIRWLVSEPASEHAGESADEADVFLAAHASP